MRPRSYKMARSVCVCVALLLLTVCKATDTIVKGLYCQDPDTGKLYPVNSTWPSQSFCGNYTCKLRKKNITATEYTPIHKFDITKYVILDKNDTKNDMAPSPSENSIVITKKTDNDKISIFHKDLSKNKVTEPIKNDKDMKNSDDYLTEAEIKTITEMLHTIKKSDLEAIVDIYNLAQEIYKEIDSDEIAKEVPKAPEKLDTIENMKDYQQSYWYDPTQYHNKHTDMFHDNTNIHTIKNPPLDTHKKFLNGPFTEKDFGKLPYYYPKSSFQRTSSYTHPKQTINDLEKSPSEAKPCSKPVNNYNYAALPWYNVPSKSPQLLTTGQPSTLLPYPFSYIYHYNVSGYQPHYYYGYPWADSNNNRQRKYVQPYYGAYIAQIPSYSAPNQANLSEKEKSSESNISEEQLLDTLNSSVENNNLPDWQTGPLSDNVLDEVRAYIKQPKIKPISLKKNIKLERIGKVLKLDELTRKKREVINDNPDTVATNEVFGDDLEPYIEKTVCENSTEPGFFSYGNMSEPYPSCCPKKLDNIHTKQAVIKIK